jgi:hypothetical protein
MLFMQRVLIGLFLLLTIATAHATWNVDTTTDSMTDEVKQAAKVTNDDGHSLSIYRHTSGAVWANFSLSNRSLDQLSPQKPPAFRVDKNEPQDIANEKRLQEMGVGIQAFAWEPKWVNFLIWHGKESEGRSKTLDQLMQGTSVVFRYYLFTGGYKETTFSLDGGGKAIASALDISTDVDKAAAERAEELKRAYLAATKTCQKDMSTFRPCFERVNSCRKQSNNDLAAFQQCMQ